jgi:hypothetical protein
VCTFFLLHHRLALGMPGRSRSGPAWQCRCLGGAEAGLPWGLKFASASCQRAPFCVDQRRKASWRTPAIARRDLGALGI